MSEDVKLRIVANKQENDVPEESGAPSDCDVSYLNGRDPPPGATVYEGPDGGEFYCPNHLNDDQQDSEEVGEDIEAWGLPGDKDTTPISEDDSLDKGEFVVFSTEEGVYTGRVISSEDGIVEINSTISNETIEVEIGDVSHKVDNSSDRNILEFRFGNIGYNDLDSNNLKKIFNIPEEGNIQTDIDSLSVKDDCIVEKDGIGVVYARVIESNEDTTTLGTYDSKISGHESGARIEFDTDELLNNNLVGVVENVGLKRLTQNIVDIDEDTDVKDISVEDLSFNDRFSASIDGIGNVTGSVFNTDYLDQGVIGMRISNGAGQDRLLWIEEKNISDIGKLSDDISQDVLGLGFGTLQFPKDAQLDRNVENINDGDIGLASIGGTQIAGIVDGDSLIADPSKYSTINEIEDGEYELKSSFGENKQLDKTEDGFVKVPVEDTWIGTLDNVKENDVLKLDPDDWSFEKESEYIDATTTLRDVAKENYSSKVDINSSDTAWSKFIQETLERGGSGVVERLLDAVMNSVTLLGELSDKSYEEGFDDLDSTRQRRREKFEQLERSAEEAFSQASKVEVEDAPNPVSFGYYKRKERGEDNFDYFRELFAEDIDEEIYSSAEEALDAYSRNGSRSVDSAPIYHAISEVTGYESVPTYYEDVDEIDGKDPIEYWRDRLGEDFADTLSEEDFKEGQPMVQFDKDRASENIDNYENKKQGIIDIREKTQELLQDSLPGDSIPLYRAIGGDDVVSNVQDSIDNDSAYHMQQESVNSWTSSPEKALMFGNNKAGQKHSELTDNYAIVRADIPIENIAVFSEFVEGLDMGGQAEFIVEGSEDGLEIESDSLITGQAMRESEYVYELPDDPTMFEQKVKSDVVGVGEKTLETLRNEGIEDESEFESLTFSDVRDIRGMGSKTATKIMSVARNEPVFDPTDYGANNDDLDEYHNNGLITVEDYQKAENIFNSNKLPNKLEAGRGERDPQKIAGDEEWNDKMTDDLWDLLNNVETLTNRQIKELIDQGFTSLEDLTDANQAGGAGENTKSLKGYTLDAVAEYAKGNEEKSSEFQEKFKEYSQSVVEDQRRMLESLEVFEGNGPDAIREPTKEIDVGDGETAEIPAHTMTHLAAWSLEGLNGDRAQKSLSKQNNEVVEIEINPKFNDWLRHSEDSISRGDITPKSPLPSSPTLKQLHNISKSVDHNKNIKDIIDMDSNKTAGVEKIETDELTKWRIYVDNESDVPGWAEVVEGPRGGIYYIINDSELVNHLLTEPLHELPEDVDPDDYDWEPTTQETQQTTIDEWSLGDAGDERLINNQYEDSPSRSYWRVYVDNEEQAPDWANVQGPSSDGNLYYIVFDEDLFRELVTEPKHEVSEDYDIDSYLDGSYNEVEEKEYTIRKRKFHIYVESESDVPDWAQTKIGPYGGIYYTVYYKPLFNELMRSPKHEVSDDFDLSSYMYSGPANTTDRNPEEKSVNIIDINKRRIYIDDPSEAPDGKQIHRGDKGGLYYISGSNIEENEEEEEEKSEYNTYSDFSEKLAESIKTDSLKDIETQEYANNIDSIKDEKLLENVYKLEEREAIKREIKSWANKLNTHFEYSYKEDGPRVTKNIKSSKQVVSLCDKSINEDDLSKKEENVMQEWEELKEKVHKTGESLDPETRREFKESINKIDNELIVFYLWESGLDGFSDLNTILMDRLLDLGYNPRVEIIPGKYRRLDYKYNYDINDPNGQLADIIESNSILRSIIQEDQIDRIQDISNVDFLGDIKTALKYKGISRDSTIIKAINKRIQEINPKPLETYNIDSELYKKVINRPAGYKGKGHAFDKKTWTYVFKNVSTQDLEEIAKIAEDRNNFAHLSVIKGLLSYRCGSTMSSRDMVSIRYDGGEYDEEYLYSVLERIIANLHPIVGSFVLSALTRINSESMMGNKDGYVLYRGEISIDGRKTESWEADNLITHLVGHILHRICGLDAEEDMNDEEDNDGLPYTVLRPENEDNEFSQLLYDKMRKEWTRYTSMDANECRIYQRTGPSIFMVTTFSMWINDPMKLEIAHEGVYNAYESFFGVGE